MFFIIPLVIGVVIGLVAAPFTEGYRFGEDRDDKLRAVILSAAKGGGIAALLLAVFIGIMLMYNQQHDSGKPAPTAQQVPTPENPSFNW